MGFTKGNASVTIAELIDMRKAFDVTPGDEASRAILHPETWKRIKRHMQYRRTRKDKTLIRHIENNRRQQAVHLYDSMSGIEKIMVSPMIPVVIRMYRDESNNKSVL